MLPKLILLLIFHMFHNWEFTASGPTVIPSDPFVAEKDVEIIFKAVDKFGTDEKTISKVLCRRIYEQRKLIAEAYEKKHGETLKRRLEKETSRDLKKLYRRLLESPQAILTYDLYDTIHKKRDDKGAVIEIFCASENSDKILINEFYPETFPEKKPLLEDVKFYKGENKEYQEALRDYCWNTTRCEILTKSDNEARELAAALLAVSFKDGEEAYTNFKTHLQTYLRTYCIPDLGLIFKHFRSLGNCGIEKAIHHAIKDKDTADAYTTLAQVMENKFRYWAELLQSASDGSGTDEDRINRILVITSERYLGDIDEEYEALYKESFLGRLCGLTGEFGTQGDYQQAIKYLFGK